MAGRGAFVAALILACAAPVRAQIYTWRDASGNLVLSNTRPAGTPVRTFAVPDSPSLRTTRGTVAERSRLYDDVVVEHARLNDVRADLVRAVVQVESAYNRFARSAKGALGLMQLMPATIQRFGVKNPFDPVENIRAGVAYLRELLDRYGNNEQLALAAYNAGPGAVDSHGRTVPPYRETRDYVKRIDNMSARAVERRGAEIYKVTELVDGREVVRYTDQKPPTGRYEVVGR